MAKENGGVIGIINTPTSTTASGVWALQDQYEAKRNSNWPLTPFVSPYSARFNSGSSDNLNRTFTTPTSGTTWSINFWVKKSSNGSAINLCSRLVDGSNEDRIRFTSGDALEWSVYKSGAYAGQLVTTQLFRDNSAWYNILCVWDTSNATAGNRMRMYLNGSEITAFSTDTNPTQNTTSLFNASGSNHRIGSVTSGEYFNGYMSEIILVDGQALTPSSFGASNASGVWYPIPYTGSYGNNGFYLKFGNASSLGTDSSPNGNNFTVNNLTSVDQSTDSTLNNFCTLNPLDINAMTLTEGNLASASVGATWKSARATFGISKGKWYWEMKATASASSYDAQIGVGLFSLAIASYPEWNSANPSVVYSAGDGSKWLNGVNSSYGASYTVGDIIGVAFDADNLTVTFYKNGTSQGTITTSWSVDTYALQVAFYGRSGGTTSGSFNFGSPPYAANGYADGAGYGNFSYAVPSGYYALCTANLNTYG